MKLTGKIFLWTSVLLLLLWVLPWLYQLISLKGYSSPFTLYSCTVHDFTSLDRNGGRDLRFVDRQGQVHGEEAQPTFYASVLASNGTLPDTLEGRPVTLAEIERNSVIATSDPKDVNRTKAPVYLLMESVPVRLELQDPEEALVSRRDGIYIYKLADNTLQQGKTDSLNMALRSLEFAFPARLFAGNPSHRKEYDEGWLVTDARDRVFQIKQTDGVVSVKPFPSTDGIGVNFLQITEFENHATLAYLTGSDGFLQILRPDGELIRTEVPFDARKEDLLVVGDLFYYTVKVSTQAGERFYALRSDDFSLVDTMERDYPQGFSLPGIRFASPDDSWIKLRLRGFRE